MLLGSGGRVARTFLRLRFVGRLAAIGGLGGRVAFAALGILGVLWHASPLVMRPNDFGAHDDFMQEAGAALSEM